MRNIKLVIAYDGLGYVGWQRQNNQPTIQGVLEEKLAVMTVESLSIHGAGRTDAGVHALGMTANFHTESTISCDGFLRGLNSLLPLDIRVLEVSEAEPDFHARRSAKGKCYLYTISICPVQLPTERHYTVNLTGNFEIASVKKCLKALVGLHDFSSFEATGSRDVEFTAGRGAVREIYSADLEIVTNDPLILQIIIAGDGFLRHMVRNIVGTVIEVGQGKTSFSEFREIFHAKDRTLAGPTAPAKGLFLKEVFY